MIDIEKTEIEIIGEGRREDQKIWSLEVQVSYLGKKRSITVGDHEWRNDAMQTAPDPELGETYPLRALIMDDVTDENKVVDRISQMDTAEIGRYIEPETEEELQQLISRQPKAA